MSKGPKRKNVFENVLSSRSRNMSAIKSKNTKPEILLRKILRELGLHYRLHYKKLPGRPDIVLPKYKIAIFCDGDFWHGRRWKQRKEKGFNVRPDYWISKIERNIARDKRNNRELKKLGWKVLRFWASDINKKSNKVIQKISENSN